MRISDWSSDVCSSDLVAIQATRDRNRQEQIDGRQHLIPGGCEVETGSNRLFGGTAVPFILARARCITLGVEQRLTTAHVRIGRSEERRVGKECVCPGRSRWWPYH